MPRARTCMEPAVRRADLARVLRSVRLHGTRRTRRETEGGCLKEHRPDHDNRRIQRVPPTAGRRKAPYEGIPAGPDGRVAVQRFTETSENKIGRITTIGELSEFLLPQPRSEPVGITAGPDGALWFTEYTRMKIGRITTTGEPSEFLIPPTISCPAGITVGSDGAVWFTKWEWKNKISLCSRCVSAQAHACFLAPAPRFLAPATRAAGFSPTCSACVNSAAVRPVLAGESAGEGFKTALPVALAGYLPLKRAVAHRPDADHEQDAPHLPSIRGAQRVEFSDRPHDMTL
jgi:hypothetical protein